MHLLRASYQLLYFYIVHTIGFTSPRLLCLYENESSLSKKKKKKKKNTEVCTFICKLVSSRGLSTTLISQRMKAPKYLRGPNYPKGPQTSERPPTVREGLATTAQGLYHVVVSTMLCL